MSDTENQDFPRSSDGLYMHGIAMSPALLGYILAGATTWGSDPPPGYWIAIARNEDTQDPCVVMETDPGKAITISDELKGEKRNIRLLQAALLTVACVYPDRSTEIIVTSSSQFSALVSDLDATGKDWLYFQTDELADAIENYRVVWKSYADFTEKEEPIIRLSRPQVRRSGHQEDLTLYTFAEAPYKTIGGMVRVQRPPLQIVRHEMTFESGILTSWSNHVVHEWSSGDHRQNQLYFVKAWLDSANAGSR